MARILIVDDDPVFGNLTVRRLSSAGHVAELMTGPEGVLTQARETTYDLLLLDVMMPHISGSLLAQAISSRLPKETKLVFLSSLDESELEKLTKTHGADGWVSKSANRAELLEALSRLGVE